MASRVIKRVMSTQKEDIIRTVKTRLEDSVFYIGIDRPAKRNCVNHSTALQLLDAFKKFNQDPQIKIGILYGEGSNFCAGYDLSEVSSGSFDQVDPTFLEENRYMGPSIMTLEKPLIAAIEGFAVAGGLELALMADLRVASKSSTLGVFCRRVGVPLIDGGTVRLPRVIGISRALDMILTGRGVEATEALQWGLVNRVVDDGNALSAATSLAKEIIAHPYSCMLTDRNSAIESQGLSLAEGFEKEFRSIAVLPEAIKGAQKFINGSKKSKL